MFKYKLQKILDHKKTLEDLAKKDYLEAQRRVDDKLEFINNMYRDIERSRSFRFAAEVAGGATSSLSSLSEAFIKLQEIKINKAKQEARELMFDAEDKHELLVAAAREHKVFQKLKDKSYQEYKKWRKHLENKNIDEISVLRYKRNKNEVL